MRGDLAAIFKLIRRERVFEQLDQSFREGRTQTKYDHVPDDESSCGSDDYSSEQESEDDRNKYVPEESITGLISGFRPSKRTSPRAKAAPSASVEKPIVEEAEEPTQEKEAVAERPPFKSMKTVIHLD